jgi:ubiquinone biosynthesis protein
VLLQKTLLNIEGLGRDLDPGLDLWKTAKPFLERWMSEQVGWPALQAALEREAPAWANLVPALPRLIHRALENAAVPPAPTFDFAMLVHEQQRTRRLLWLTVSLSTAALSIALVMLSRSV